MGRPKVMGPEEKAKCLQWIEDGLLSRAKCCERLGIQGSVFSREMRRDPEFAKAVQEKEFLMHDQIVSALRNHTIKDYRACQYILAQKWGQDWAKKNTYTSEEVLGLALKMSELITKYVPEHQQIDFATKVEAIINDLEKSKTSG